VDARQRRQGRLRLLDQRERARVLLLDRHHVGGQQPHVRGVGIEALQFREGVAGDTFVAAAERGPHLRRLGLRGREGPQLDAGLGELVERQQGLGERLARIGVVLVGLHHLPERRDGVLRPAQFQIGDAEEQLRGQEVGTEAQGLLQGRDGLARAATHRAGHPELHVGHRVGRDPGREPLVDRLGLAEARGLHGRFALRTEPRGILTAGSRLGTTRRQGLCREPRGRQAADEHDHHHRHAERVHHRALVGRRRRIRQPHPDRTGASPRARMAR
jgi:hypothetical protein